MILSKSLTASQMAKAAECSKRSIINISNKLRRFGNARLPPTRVGRRRSITPPMIEALCDRLLEKPGLYIDEMAIFLWDEFRVQVTNSSLKRALASVGWSKKLPRQRGKEQNADLRDFYTAWIEIRFTSYTQIFFLESSFKTSLYLLRLIYPQTPFLAVF
jgi:transposase